MREQSPVLRLDLHERLPLEPLKGRVEEILDLELIPEVEIDVNEAQVSLCGQMTIKGTYLAETLPLTEYEWEQDPSPEEVRVGRTSEPFPFVYQIPLEIVLPRHRVPDPRQLRVSVSQMDFDLSSPHELEVLAELVVEGAQGEEERAEQWRDLDVEAARDMEASWTVQLLSGKGLTEPGDPESLSGREPSEEKPDVADGAPAQAEDEFAQAEDEFEVVARPEKAAPSLQTDGSLSEEEPASWEETVPDVQEEHFLEGASSWDETAEDGLPDAEKTNEEPVASGESVRVMVSAHSKEEPGGEVSATWSEWLTPSQKQNDADMASGDGSGEAADGEASAPEEPAAGETASEEVASMAETALHAENGHPSPGRDVRPSREEERDLPTLSEYLAPILKGKAERFVSLRLYRVQETEHLEDVAQQFNVSVSELMRLNRIEQPTFLAAGNVLFIPLKKE